MRSLSLFRERGKSGLHRAGRWRNPSGREPKESATETNRPAFIQGFGARYAMIVPLRTFFVERQVLE